MRKTQGNGIILMRNPYHVIFGYRNYFSRVDTLDTQGIADVSKFFGKGKYKVVSNEVLSQSNAILKKQNSISEPFRLLNFT